MKKTINQREYKVGDICKAASFVASGLSALRIEKSIGKNGAVRVVFVFSKDQADVLEARYLSNDLQVDARTLIGTIEDMKSIIKNVPRNIEK